MKNLLFLMTMSWAIAAFSMTPSIQWLNANMKLGEVRLHEKQTIKFEFTNKSSQKIKILEAKGSCGCTVVDLPETDIAAGSTATILAEFTPSKVGAFRKNVRIKTSVSDDYTYLYFSGSVTE